MSKTSEQSLAWGRASASSPSTARADASAEVRPPAAARKRRRLLFAPDPLAPRARPRLWAYPPIQWHPDPRNHDRARLYACTLMLQLRFHRVEQSLTREELSDLTSVPVSTIKRAERFGEISLERFAQLALHLGLDGELQGLFARRRYKVPSVVLVSRGKNAKHGRRDRRRQMARVAAEVFVTPRGRA